MVQLGSTAIGVKTKHGVVLTVEKRITSPLLVRAKLDLCPAGRCQGQDRAATTQTAVQEPSSVEKVAEVDEHIGVAMSGLTADARTLIDHARVECQVIQQQSALEAGKSVMSRVPATGRKNWSFCVLKLHCFVKPFRLWR